MGRRIYSVIKGTGKYIPDNKISNDSFLGKDFFDTDGSLIQKENAEIVEKFKEITTIKERRYVDENMVTSDISAIAAEDALVSSGIDRETLDYVIVAHNFGDVTSKSKVVDIVPSLASRVKQKLKIKNPGCVAYDITFGCPGWLQGMIQADYFLRSGDAKRALVIGADVLSRLYDPHDRDSMIYSDGAGATILEAVESEEPIGILGHSARSDTLEYAQMLFMGESYNQEYGDDRFLKMNGRKLYQYALEHVPQAIKDCLDKCNTKIQEVKKVLIHQANGKMDEAILKRLFRLYKETNIPEDIMPMTISWLGNSSVATVPSLLDLILKGELKPHTISSGDTLVFASVGAGMNINAVLYKS